LAAGDLVTHKYKFIETRPYSVEVVGPRKIFSARDAQQVERPAAVVFMGRLYVSPEEARQFAAKVNEAADLAEKWQEEGLEEGSGD
jgi:catalase (peroxidase I)